MRIMFHGWEFPPEGGGVGAYMNAMARALHQAGHYVVVVTGKPTGDVMIKNGDAGLVYHAYDRSEIGSTRVRDLVLALAREHKVDIIEGADHLGDCASLLDAPHRPPVLVKIHGCNVIRVLRDSHVRFAWQRLTIGAALWRQQTKLQNEQRCIERADLVTFPSQRLWDEVKRQGLHLPSACAVIPNPMEILPAEPIAEAEQPTLLFVGRLEIGKGIEYLPDILRATVARYPNAVLELAGSDTYARGLGSLQAWLSKRLGPLQRHVRFLGRLSAAELHQVYRRAWVVVIPSRWDTFPTVMLEAMARAKAIVASPHGGMPAMLQGTSNMIVNPRAPEFAETVISLLGNTDLRHQAGLSGYRKVTTAYSPEAVVRQYEHFIAGAQIPP